MYCRKCGKALRDGAKYCLYCGAAVVQRHTPAQQGAQKVNAALSQFVPKSWNKKYPSYGAIAFCSACAAALLLCAVLVVSLAVSFIGGRHDLSGTYVYDGRFPVTRITFSTDGTFEASCDYYEYDTGAVYHGKYRKNGRTYSLKITGAKSGSKNPVVGFTDKTIGEQFSLEAEKLGDSALRVTVVPGLSYYAWSGSYADFYKR